VTVTDGEKHLVDEQERLLKAVDKFQNAFVKYSFSPEKKKGKQILLSPLTFISFFYKQAVILRNRAYHKGFLRARKLSIPVISIGNLTVGGTGKTPTTVYLARLLQSMGKRVGVLSRGYRGSASGIANVVSDGEKVRLGPCEAGDEPFLIAEKLPGIVVLTGKDRGLAGEYAQKNFSIDVALLDDGFQHIKLKRDLDILLLDGRNPLGNGYLLPRGSLREPPESIRRAHLVLVSHADKNYEKIKERIHTVNLNAPIFFADYIPVGLERLASQEKLSLDFLHGKTVHALAGVARPENFVSILAQMGAEVKETLFFPDHHFYHPKELTSIDKNSIIVTTEKDAVKLKLLSLPACDILVLKIELSIEHDEKFQVFLKKYLPY
jgi:tetraacyldisaccharide 4'-kinase